MLIRKEVPLWLSAVYILKDRGCRSKWYFWPNASVREFIGLLTQHRIKQGLILLGMIASYAAMTLIYYSL